MSEMKLEIEKKEKNNSTIADTFSPELRNIIENNIIAAIAYQTAMQHNMSKMEFLEMLVIELAIENKVLSDEKLKREKNKLLLKIN